MNLVDVVLFCLAVVFIGLILLLIKAVSSSELLNLLSLIGIADSSAQGIKNIFILILVASALTFIIILILFFRLFLRMLKKNR